MGLEAALTWKTCTFGLTKKLQMNRKAFGVPRFLKIYHNTLLNIRLYMMQNATTKRYVKPINSDGHLRQFLSVSKYICNPT